MKRYSKIALVVALALSLTGLAGPTPLRAQAAAELTIARISGPSVLKAGLSGTYEVTIRNDGNVPAPLEVHIIFAGTLDQTDRIVAEAGLTAASLTSAR